MALRYSVVRSVLAGAGVAVCAALALQCSSSSGSDGRGGFGGSSGGSGGQAGGGGSAAGGGVGGSAAGGGLGGTGGGFLDATGGPTQDISIDAFFVDDPPPPACNGNMNTPVNPGGTPRCPGDKNLEGCPCDPDLAQPQPCWPGFRRHRNRGACEDGETTCMMAGENRFIWGPCENFAGIDPMTFEPLGDTGRSACGCFSAGFWNVPNVSPCFFTVTDQTGSRLVGISTVLDSSAQGGSRCPDPNQGEVDMGITTPPTTPFSTNTVRSDCPGFFKLCYTFKALSAPMAMQQPATDCVMKEICTEAQYSWPASFDPLTANSATDYPEQDFPDLPAWITETSDEISCAQQFFDNGGYAEMSVDGQSDECEMVDKVFQTVTYCPLTCNEPANAMNPECINCSNGAAAPF